MRRASDIILLLLQVLIIVALTKVAGSYTTDLYVIMVAWLIMISGFVIGLFALYELRHSLAVAPEPVAHSSLVDAGVYKYIRHPMYSAVMLVCFGYLIAHFSWLALGIFLIIVVYFLVKLSYEERLLLKRFDNYESYKHRTKALIPGIY